MAQKMAAKMAAAEARAAERAAQILDDRCDALVVSTSIKFCCCPMSVANATFCGSNVSNCAQCKQNIRDMLGDEDAVAVR